MPRHCMDVCTHLPHIRTLRWVKCRYLYKYCSKCGVYFRAPKTQIVCECCKDTLRVQYGRYRHYKNTYYNIHRDRINDRRRARYCPNRRRKKYLRRKLEEYLRISTTTTQMEPVITVRSHSSL